MTNIFNGVAIIIDDEADVKTANISKLIKQIEKKKIPYVKYLELPSKEIIPHIKNISFLLLDWNLATAESSDALLRGVRPSQHTGAVGNLDFLDELIKHCFVPIFIFTNEDKANIISELTKRNLYRSGAQNLIFVENKSNLIGQDNLFKTLDKWTKKIPSVYVLKEWERGYQDAKTKLFHDLFTLSPAWPRILWESFSADSVDMSMGLGETITRNIHTRMAPFCFDEKFFKKNSSITHKEMRHVLCGERFIQSSELHKGMISTGDVFEFKNKIYINIRPDCDCVPNRNKSNKKPDNIPLYLLRGEKQTESWEQKQKSFMKKYGHFPETDAQAIVVSIIHGGTYAFRFKDLTIKSWGQMKASRIGRLLPPYITRIQQRYSAYLQRQGLPRTPKIAVAPKNRVA